MAKNFLNDIRPSTTSREDKRSRIEDVDIEESARPVQLPPRFRERTFTPAPRGRGRKTIWILVVLVVISGAIATLTYFASANVSIIQKAENITLDNTSLNATLAGDDKTLSFKLVKLTGSAEKVVTGGIPTAVAIKAAGRVVIYNNFSTAQQKLTIETRLATTDGKIFKTDTAVTVPGFKTVAGKTTPGSVEVGVHADAPGAAYNIPLSDFTIFGFKGTPKYTKFYARSKTVMSGGASGTGIALGEADARVAHEAALSILREKLTAEIKTSLPDASVLLPGAFVLKEDPDSGQTVADKNVMVVKGAMYGILFNKDEFSKKIASIAVSQFDGGEITIPELSTFTIDIKNKEAINDTASTVSFSVSGKGHVLWQVPVGEIVAKLVGTNKHDIGKNLSLFGSVAETSVKVSPFWSIHLPSKPESIHVTVTDPKSTN